MNEVRPLINDTPGMPAHPMNEEQYAEYLKMQDELSSEPFDYDEAVNTEIRKKYSESQEFAILRQKDEKPTEYQTYYTYCENCKANAKRRQVKHA